MEQVYNVLLLQMPNNGGSGVSGISIILVIIVIFYIIKQSKIKNLKQEYDEALRSGDKQKALAAGRRYYGKLRSDGRLTVYDEQAIANDINAMI